MQLLMFAAGLVLLVVGANLLVRGASSIARIFGISPLVVGLTIVAYGTSAPEIAVSIGSVLDGRGELAIGNAVGSNIFNVLFILGACALISPLAVNRQLIRQDVPVMLVATVLLLLLGLDGMLSWRDGMLLTALLLLYTGWLVFQARRQAPEANTQGVVAVADETPPATPKPAAAAETAAPRRGLVIVRQLISIVLGLAGLVVGADWLVEASVAFARMMGVSELVIGLTIVAAGTSLPEVATSIAAALNGERDIAVGNVVGSNTFNILGCLGLTSLVSGDAGLAVPASVQAFDMWVLLAISVACVPVFISGREIVRWEGALFLFYYLAYSTYLILDAQQHAALPVFSTAILNIAVPITVLTFAFMLMREQRRKRGR